MPGPLTEQQILRRVIELERAICSGEDLAAELGFTWKDVPAPPATLNKMVINGVLKVSYDSSTSTCYRLKMPIEEAEKLLELEDQPEAEGKIEIPDDIFAPLVGFEDLRGVILKSLAGDKPVHVLIISPPATAAKSTILMELERIPGAVYLSVGGTATRAGLRDTLLDKPRILLLDELDKCQSDLDLSALTTWMESGRVTVAKHGFRKDVKGKGWVFAAANSKRGIRPELLDRFIVFNIPPYTREQYMEIVGRVLTMREGVDSDTAKFVAEKLASEGSRSVRKAIQVARLSRKREDIDGILETMRKYR